jgi:hypothetical protein
MGLQGSQLDPAVRLRGWQKLGAEVGETFAQLPNPAETMLVVSDGRALASELAFYMPQHPEAFVWNPSGQIVSQYDVWGGPQLLHGRDALIVTTQPSIPAGLAQCFTHVEALQQVCVAVGPRRQHRTWLWRGVALEQAVARKEPGFGNRERERYANSTLRPAGLLSTDCRR